jgi:hypothetical protein
MMKKNLPSLSQKSVNENVQLNIEATLNLIPIAGGFLATYFGELRSKKMQERMQAYFDYFTERINSIDENKIDHAYLQSEEFAELLVHGAELSAKSTQKKRIERFANILINNSMKNSSRERTENIISFVDRISDLDGIILLSFGHPAKESIRTNSKIDAITNVLDFCKYVGIDLPEENKINEAILYLDNLGLMWVTQKETNDDKAGILGVEDYSCFRSTFGSQVASVIAPIGFYVDDIENKYEWPKDFVFPIVK